MQIKFFILIILSMAISGCQTRFNSGTLITEDEMNQVSKATTTKTQVEEKFGSPNIIPDYSKDNWYYVHRSMTKRAFLNPVIVSQRVVRFSFVNDKLMEMEAFENKHNGEIKVLDEYIRTRGTELNPIQEYIGNIGRFNSYKKKETRR